MDFLSHQKSPCIICQCAYIDLNIKNSSEPVCLSKVNRTEREREWEKEEMRKFSSTSELKNWKAWTKKISEMFVLARIGF